MIKGPRERDPCLLQWRDKGLELGGSVFHKQQARQGEVEGRAAAAVGGIVEEGKVLGSVVLQDVGGEVKLQQQLAACVASRQILHSIDALEICQVARDPLGS